MALFVRIGICLKASYGIICELEICLEASYDVKFFVVSIGICLEASYVVICEHRNLPGSKL